MLYSYCEFNDVCQVLTELSFMSRTVTARL